MDLRSAWEGFQAAWDQWRRTGSNTSWATIVAAYDALHTAIDNELAITPPLERRASGFGEHNSGSERLETPRG